MSVSRGKKSKNWLAIAEVVGIVLLGVLLLHRLLPNPPETASAANAKSFTLTGMDGTAIPLSAYQGKALVLNYWAPWCPPCRVEIPWLQKLQNEENGRLVVVGVVAEPRDNEHAVAMMRRLGITYLLVQNSDSLQAAFGSPSALPTSYYLSPSLHVVHSVKGLVPEYIAHRYASDAIGAK
jgi:cytochrome c biogenesis protein CcmG/thiol:disulfide interchange protein DsbE